MLSINRQINIGLHHAREILCVLPVGLFVATVLSGCSERTEPATEIVLTITDEGFLQFSGGGADDEEELDRLNDEIEQLVDEYHETLDDNEINWTVCSQLASGDRVLQGTIYITKDQASLLSGAQQSRQLASFAYDTQTHTGYTALDALREDPLTGVDLSTRVQKAFRALEPDAELLSTEMQGFLLNDNATTQFLYMQIEMDPDPENPGERPTEQFYLYDPDVDAMAIIEWPV